MAISLKTAGTWAEYTTDLQTVAIPGSPAAGDRMFLFVSWKDFAITLAQPAGWTTIVNSFADGTVSTGNGTGSISQAVFYRDWVSGDAAPTLDFSTTTNLLAEAVVMLWTKGASPEVYKAPVYVTAAWPVTANPQTVSASSAILVPDNCVVMAHIAIRDDSATFTRGATTGIDVASGITWSADYVESPATHYTTITGNDHSGDLGHRLITTGGSGTSTVTLRVTATLSATETGSVVWVVQGVDTPTTVTPSTLSVVTSTFAPTVTPTNNKLVTPTTLSVTTTKFAPTVSAPRLVTPTTLALITTEFAPTVSTPRLATPSTLAVVTSTFAPVVSTPQTVTPTTAVLSTATFAPTAATPVVATPTTRALVTATFAPDVMVEAGGVTVTPSTASLTTTEFAPTVTATDNQRVVPATLALTTARFAPTVSTTADVLVTPPKASLVLSLKRPTVTATGTTQLVIAGYEPQRIIPLVIARPRPAKLATQTFPPVVQVGDDADVLAILRLIA